MKINEYLDAVKAKLDLPSDYALAKVLGVTHQSVMQYRNGKSAMGVDTCLKAGEILRMDGHKVYADGQIERAKNSAQSEFWREISEKFSTSFLDLLLGRSPHVA